MSSVSLQIGKTAQAIAVATDPTGQQLTATFTWASSDAGIATVDGNGVVTAVAVGSALITASTTINGVDGSGSAGVDVAAPTQFAVTVTITPN
jgi:uncharacterized protein YjdB